MTHGEIITRLDLDIRASEQAQRQAQTDDQPLQAKIIARRLADQRARRLELADQLVTMVGQAAATAQINHWRRELDSSFGR